MVSRTLRDQVRVIYDFRCGYCGVSEAESGGELDVDHFRPLLHGGADELENLVYACVTCNRFKGDYWPVTGAGLELMLLHPQHDDLSAHLTLMSDGRLSGLMPRGWFHIQRLHLNREPLVALRRRREMDRQLQQMLADSQHAQAALRAYSRRLEQEIATLLEAIARLTAGSE